MPMRAMRPRSPEGLFGFAMLEPGRSGEMPKTVMIVEDNELIRRSAPATASRRSILPASTTPI